MKTLYFDPDGVPIPLLEWAAMFETTSRFVADTQVELPGGGHARVATIWEGIDHSFGEDAIPLIFETTVFLESGNYGSDAFCERSPTRHAALAIHDQAIEWARNLGLDPLTRKERQNDA